MMKTNTVAVVVLLSIAATPGWAFQEQRIGGGPAPAAGTAPAALGPETGSSLADTEAVSKNPAGTEVRIPGLGKLGVIPKVDFGLELLYGAADSKRPSDPPAGSENADGVTLRGKLRF